MFQLFFAVHVTIVIMIMTTPIMLQLIASRKKGDNNFHCLMTKFRMIITTVASFFSNKVNKVSVTLVELRSSTLSLQLS